MSETVADDLIIFGYVHQPRPPNLRGYVTVQIAGIIIHDLSLYVDGAGRAWVLSPGRPALTRWGEPVRDKDKVRYMKVISFPSKTAEATFSHRVVMALYETNPEAFR